jgi:hypothetical protein
MLAAAVALLGIDFSRRQANANDIKMPASQTRVSTLAGHVKGADLKANAAAVLGTNGAMLIRSPQRWRWLMHTLHRIGWTQAGDKPLGELDFNKEMVAFVFDCGDEKNEFSLQSARGQADQFVLDVLMSAVIYKQRDRIVNDGKFLFVALPQAPQATVRVLTWHPLNGGAHSTPETAELEWQCTLGANHGDVVDCLRGTIRAPASKVQAGGDLAVQFTLELATDCVAAEGLFSSKPVEVAVWDGMYSMGYRNYFFQVTTPDGKVQTVRRAEFNNWRKNVPRREAVKPGKPYVLPQGEAKDQISLTALGLDTVQPGRYTITGFYEERGEAASDGLPAIWGGNIATNTITVEVIKAQ